MSVGSSSNLSNMSFLNSHEFRSMKRSNRHQAHYSLKHSSVDQGEEANSKSIRKKPLSQKRKPIRGQMGTYLPAMTEAARERRDRLMREQSAKKHHGQHDEAEHSGDDAEAKVGNRASNGSGRFELPRELKPLREDMYEIPSHSVMKVWFIKKKKHLFSFF